MRTNARLALHQGHKPTLHLETRIRGQQFLPRGFGNVATPRANDIERSTLVQQVRFDTVCQRRTDVHVQRDGFGDDVPPAFLHSLLCQEVFGREGAFHGKALHFGSGELRGGIGEADVVER